MTDRTNIWMAQGAERTNAISRLTQEWGDPIIIRGARYPLAECEIIVAEGMRAIAAVCLRDAPVAELVAMNVFHPREGLGNVTLTFICGWLSGCSALRVTTTNDNLDALRFYQRRGFRLSALRPGALNETRRLKHSVPVIGNYGIPLLDELDLVRML